MVTSDAYAMRMNEPMGGKLDWTDDKGKRAWKCKCNEDQRATKIKDHE